MRERAGGMIQVVEHLPSEHDTPSSNPYTVKERKKKEKVLDFSGLALQLMLQVEMKGCQKET
jgi:hypothetical protein